MKTAKLRNDFGNNRDSLNRPGWTSCTATGMFEAYRHLHVSKAGRPIIENYFVKTHGKLRK